MAGSRSATDLRRPREKHRLSLVPLVISHAHRDQNRGGTHPTRPWYIYGDLGSDIPFLHFYRETQH